MGNVAAKEPRDRAWTSQRNPLGMGVFWTCGPIRVLSSLDMAKLPRSEEVGPTWHISIATAAGKRPKPHHVRKALRTFGMVGVELDNHHPGNAQHYFMPVDPAARVPCECKEDEVTVVEPDGYTWQNDPENCRGCEFARTFPSRPCPIHSRAA